MGDGGGRTPDRISVAFRSRAGGGDAGGGGVPFARYLPVIRTLACALYTYAHAFAYAQSISTPKRITRQNARTHKHIRERSLTHPCNQAHAHIDTPAQENKPNKRASRRGVFAEFSLNDKHHATNTDPITKPRPKCIPPPPPSQEVDCNRPDDDTDGGQLLGQGCYDILARRLGEQKETSQLRMKLTRRKGGEVTTTPPPTPTPTSRRGVCGLPQKKNTHSATAYPPPPRSNAPPTILLILASYRYNTHTTHPAHDLLWGGGKLRSVSRSGGKLAPVCQKRVPRRHLVAQEFAVLREGGAGAPRPGTQGPQRENKWRSSLEKKRPFV